MKDHGRCKLVCGLSHCKAGGWGVGASRGFVYFMWLCLFEILTPGGLFASVGGCACLEY